MHTTVAFAAALAGVAWAQNSAFVNPQSFRTRLLVFLLVVLMLFIHEKTQKFIIK